jgi:hypothetical protein
LGIALTAIVALDLWTVERRYWLFSAPAKVLYATDPALELLKHQTQPGRVLVAAQSDTGIVAADPYFGTDSRGRGTGLMVHGIRSVTGYHGNEMGRYQVLEDTRLPNGAPALVSPTFWRHENARWLYTNAPLTDSSFKLLVGPVRNSAGSTVYLYQLPGENPYAWVAPAIAKASDADAESAVLDPRFDPARVAVFDSSAAVQAATLRTMPEPSALTASAASFGPGRASIALSGPAPRGSALVVSENYFPGWQARVDGRAVPTYRADFNLIGVPLPVGARIIDLSFHDRAESTGKAITLVACVLALLALGAGIAADRRAGVA